MGAEGARISLMFLSLRPMDRAIAVVPLPFRQGSTYIVFLPTGVVVIPVGFCFLFRKWEEGEFYVGAFE